MKSRIFNIMQYELHPDTKEPLLNEDTIKIALAHKTIKRWAYICHDKDVYSEADEKADETHKKGEVKPRHWHIVLDTGTNTLEVNVIAKWFGIPANFVNVAKGHGAFLDCVEYLTHERSEQLALGKHQYTDEEVHTSDGFNFREELNKRLEMKVRYGLKKETPEAILIAIRDKGMTIATVEEKYPEFAIRNYKLMTQMRLRYIEKQEPPKTRYNYYIHGRGGVGKSLASRCLARALFPDIEYDSDIFFEVGDNNVTFEGYDGQPVIIWNDFRAGELIKTLGGRGNVFRVFDNHPTKGKQNIKYGSINLCNKINIINSVQPYSEFLDGLAGEYIDKDGKTHEAEDKRQAYRRVPFILSLHQSDFDVYVNKGWLEDNNEFEQYLEYANVRGNFGVVMNRLKETGNVRTITIGMCEKPKELYDKGLEKEAKENEKDSTEDLDFFKDYGKVFKREKSVEEVAEEVKQMEIPDGLNFKPQ